MDLPQLHFRSGKTALFVHVLRQGRTLVGRSDACDIALPSRSVSRVHCIVEQRSAGWTIVDRSRHGLSVNGRTTTSATLSENDEICIGEYRAVFCAAHESLDQPTATLPQPINLCDDLVEGSEKGIACCRAILRGERGPQTGEVLELKRARSTLGGPGAAMVIDDALPADAMIVRAVRGRVMIEPGSVAAHLAGQRVRDITPALPGEAIDLGSHRFTVDVRATQQPARAAAAHGDMVGESDVMRELFGAIERMGAHHAPVLLSGESGTGKELAALALHAASPRSGGPYIARNCAAITDSLFESELFGHEKGAFTGASSRTDGAFHLANGGTLFLDEVGELKPGLQAKLLRVLESGEVRRVGGSAPTTPDVRVIAATNQDLARQVQLGSFRRDLYFRLAVLSLRLPPLRERRSDIGLLARTLLERHHPGAQLTDGALHALQAYDWPGNVRELRNALTRAVILHGPRIASDALAFHPWSFQLGPEPATDPGGLSVQDASEKARLIEVLAQTKGNRTHAARHLGMPRSSLLYKIRKHGLG